MRSCTADRICKRVNSRTVRKGVVAKSGHKVIDVSRARLSEAVVALARAFEQDPLMRHLFGESVTGDDKRVQEFYRFSCVIRLDIGWPLIGVEQAGRLVSVAGLTEPGNVPWPDSLVQAHERLKSCMGPDASARLEEFSRLVEAHRPNQPHIYLGFIGTDPQAQGRGFGRALLDWTHRISEDHPGSVGVALDTENSVNVPIYEHFGYRRVAKHTLDDLNMWSMFRPDDVVAKGRTEGRTLRYE